MDNTYTNNTYESDRDHRIPALQAVDSKSPRDDKLSQEEVDILVEALQDAASEANNAEQNSAYANAILALVDRILPLQHRDYVRVTRDDDSGQLSGL